MNQPGLPPSIASGYRGSTDTSSAERLHFWPGEFGWGEALCVLAEGPDSPCLMGTPSWDPWAWVSPLTKAEAEGAEPNSFVHLTSRLMCLPCDTLGQFPTCLGNRAGSWKKKQNRLECISQGRRKPPEGSHMRLEKRSAALLINTGKQSPHHPSLEALCRKGYHHLYPLGFRHNGGRSCALW